jgi:hypothetical protein
MPSKDHHSSPAPNDPRRRYLLPGALIALAIVGIALLVLVRDDDLAATLPPATSGTTASTATTVPDTKNEVVARLQEILQIREQAFNKRDASLFDDIYTSSCPCLRAGREAIAALKKEIFDGRIGRSRLRFNRPRALTKGCGKSQHYSSPIRSVLKRRKGNWCGKLLRSVFVTASCSYGRPTQSRGYSVARLQSKANDEIPIP